MREANPAIGSGSNHYYESVQKAYHCQRPAYYNVPVSKNTALNFSNYY